MHIGTVATVFRKGAAPGVSDVLISRLSHAGVVQDPVDPLISVKIFVQSAIRTKVFVSLGLCMPSMSPQRINLGEFGVGDLPAN